MNWLLFLWACSTWRFFSSVESVLSLSCKILHRVLWVWSLLRISMLFSSILLPISTIWFVGFTLSPITVNALLTNPAQWASSTSPYSSPQELFLSLPHQRTLSVPLCDWLLIFTQSNFQKRFRTFRSCCFRASQSLFQSAIFRWPCCSCSPPASSSSKIKRNGMFWARGGPAESMIISNFHSIAKIIEERSFTRAKLLSSKSAISPLSTFLRAASMRFGKGRPVSS